MNKRDYVDQSHWDKGYEKISPTECTQEDPIRWLLLNTLPKANLRSYELGCYPGRYLAVLGELGYELNGCDLTPKVYDLSAWCQNRGYRVGTFEQRNVFATNENQHFDVVVSFGLIEHFENWEELFNRHIDRLGPDGYIVITTPNFRSAPMYLLHRILDSENLKIHNIASMNPSRWAKLAEDAGLEVVFKGGIGRFEFWADYQKRNILQKVLLKAVKATKCLWKFMPSGTLTFAPYYGIVARRKSGWHEF